jgi:(E)-4-hydroxy-3-methyl-but-2-enyl pyrophosphate reductase
MEILLAEDMGFCWGVRRAIDIIEEAAAEKGEITSLGPIVHNPQVVRDLEEKGVCFTSEPLDGTTGTVAITAHGVGPQMLEEARARSSEVVDATCPIVTRSQRWAKKMADAGFTVIVFGDPKHREVEGVLAWTGGNAIALGEGDPIPNDLPSRLAVISQTTQSAERFAQFVSDLMQKRVGEISELRVINTLCGVTSRQQAAARELAQEVGLIVIVGGRDSANTNHLLEVCREEGATAYHVESAEELKGEWFEGRQRVGVTAGTSTPDSAVEAVVHRIQEITQEQASTPIAD